MTIEKLFTMNDSELEEFLSSNGKIKYIEFLKFRIV